MRRVEGFVAMLRANVPLVRDGAILHDLLDQCMFFGETGCGVVWWDGPLPLL